MDDGAVKCVMVISGSLPVGLAVNAAGVLAATLGRRVEALVGPDVVDGSGERHAGLVRIPIPVLKADEEAIKSVRVRAAALEDLLVVDVTETAQSSRTYEEYEDRMASTRGDGLGYLGVALYGEKRAVNKLTGSLPLLR
ncbi:DUF2000 domain-containing protein [Rubrobacter marinus]|nr:DUF2000 domain-containing protein [Rubrobacter marinus]